MQPELADCPREDSDARLRDRRLAFESCADEAFQSAWAAVPTLAQVFKVELDFYRQPSGLWRDFFATTAYRPLDLPLQLLQDLGQAEGMARERIEDGLLMAGALQAAAVLVSELVLGGECHYNHEHTLLGQGLVVQAQWQMAAVAARPAAVAAWSQAHWGEHAGALLDHRSRRQQQTPDYTAQDLAQLGRRWAPLKTAVHAAADCAGRPDLVASLDPLLDEAGALFQLGRELGSIHRDLSRGHGSVPVARLVRALGGQATPGVPPDVDRALLAALLTPTLRDIAAQAMARVERLLAAVHRLGLPQMRRGLVPLAQPFAQLRSLYHPASARADAVAARPSFTLSHRPQRRQVIDAARGHLDDDPGCREAWEVYRCGFLNQPHLVSRVFPIGFILEQRIGAGDDCGAEVDGLFDLYVRNGFHYFDTPTPQPPDFDTLGLMLRLAPHAASAARCRERLAMPLAWLLQNIESDGAIPVFMARGLDPARYVPVVGRRCAAVQAGVLMGLLAHDAARFRAQVQASALHTLRWFTRVGAGAFRCHDLPYSAGMLLALAHALRGSAATMAVADAAATAEARALALLANWRQQARIHAQDAALLQLAARFPAAAALRDPAFTELLIRTQHSDGSWDAAPLYVIPSRGNLMAWYRSRLATTALAYHALHCHPQAPACTTGDTVHGRPT